jgi:2-iminoacetate synthase
MYSNIIDTIDIEKYLQLLNTVSEADFLKTLSKNHHHYTMYDFAVLLSDHGKKHIELLARKSNQITRKRFGLKIHFYVPIYLSNYCENNCVYCGFQNKNTLNRKRLNMDEYKNELNKLLSQGMRNILLVAGSDSKLFENDYIYKIIDYTNRNAASVSVEIEPQSIEIYKKMIESGLDGLVIYQETYLKNHYDKLHLSGTKKNYKNRINTPDRGASASLRRIGLGVLLGLTDYKKDILYLAFHLEYLIKKYWKVLWSVSLPRIRDAGVHFTPETFVDDLVFTQLICALRIKFNDTPIYLSTRETSSLRDGLVKCGVTNISAGSKTNPGAYNMEDSSTGSQFNVEDVRSIKDIASKIKDIGYDPVWKDWEGILNKQNLQPVGSG